jgi:hypothetical protein
MSGYLDDPTAVAKEALREFVGDGEGADEWVLMAHDAQVRAQAFEEAAEAFDLDVASVAFTASDGYQSVGVYTNEEAKVIVKAWLRERKGPG